MALYAIALAILVVGLAALGVPAGTPPIAALVVTCPLMMMFMMFGMQGRALRRGPQRTPQPGA